MAKLKLNKEFSVGVTLYLNSSFYSKGFEYRLDQFLKKKGLKKVEDDQGIVSKTLEYREVPANLTLEELEESVKKAFPELKTQLDEGVDDEEHSEYTQEYKSLWITG